ncbi:hypothetical protein, partial [uncultured Winogradskyella sp.]|uniref:hypothetical protein n=1 Tax=uncultured Winogradskyella sp. TaxID=395353 RepID=UPI0030EF712E
ILDVDSKYNVKKVLSAFQAKHDFILKKLQDSIHTIELNKSKTLWTTNKILFFGVSPFFERQSFNRFSYDESLAFKDMFKKERGSLYGITFSLNYSYERYKAYKSKYLPKNFFIRVLTTLNRASNFSNFKNTTLDIIGELGNDVNSNPITFENNDIAFVGDALYEFGFGSSLTLDMYYYPWSTPIGFFSIIGYNNIRFNRLSELDNIERYPMRLGLLFSLVNKEKNKPAVTVQAFIDRTDLNLSPNGNDNDLRFGIGIGLPINYN